MANELAKASKTAGKPVITISGIAVESIINQLLTFTLISKQQSSHFRLSLQGSNNTLEIRFKISLKILALEANH